VPDFKRTFALAASVGELGGLPMIQLRGSPITGWNAAAKRSIDLVGSAVLLIVLGFPMLLLAALVRLTSRGPVIFKQERMGLGGRRFTMQKFRSMRADAEQETGPVVGEVADPRCTGLGRLMRRLGLDELPQLVNVLRGDMSLVGPRPERPHFVEQFAQGVPAYMLRHDVKAGLTGWAQINGLRGQCSLRKRLQYDLYYINNWSLGFDLFILAATPLACFIRRRKR
jgi:exopolysaccharide biosynthesis polyprenyl glycosylphosphotransferase